jgi:hypothetical protein
VTKDGQRIFRRMGETIIEALEREGVNKPAQAHYYTFQGESDSEDSDDEAVGWLMMPASDYDSDSEDDESEYEAQVYAVDCATKKITQTRKEVLDGVYLPPIRKHKENIPPPRQPEPPQKPKPNFGPLSSHPKPQKFPSTPEQPSRVPKPQYQPPQIVQPVNQPQQVRPVNQPPRPTQVPFDAHKPRFLQPESEDEDIVMKDATRIRKPLKRSEKLDKIAIEQQAEYGRPKIIRKAEIASDLAEQQVIKNILNTPVTLPMREVLASSKELSDQLSVMIKRKNTVATTPVVTNVTVPAPIKAKSVLLEGSQERLIALNMMCGDNPIVAIIDTGSQLNVVSEECWKQAIGKPMDMKQSIEMNDANGGKGTLSGLVSDVSLNCGAVKTKANLYIGKNAPFDMLLGRPWQLGNLVCIDERVDGTYLQFKDPNSYQPRFEVLTNPERATGRNHFGNRHKTSNRSMFVQVLADKPMDTSNQDEDDSPLPLTEASSSEDEDSQSDWEWITPSPLAAKESHPRNGNSITSPARVTQDWRHSHTWSRDSLDWPRFIGNKVSQATKHPVILSKDSHENKNFSLSVLDKPIPSEPYNKIPMITLSTQMEQAISYIKEARKREETHLLGSKQPMDAHTPSINSPILETRPNLPPLTEGGFEISSQHGLAQIGHAISD